jgi:hypothetical protein
MRLKSRLEFRSLPAILAAYAVAPIVATIALAGTDITGDVRVDVDAAINDLGIFPDIFLVIEIIVVTPLLLAFRHYRWPWFNGWAAVLIGFEIGFVYSALLMSGDQLGVFSDMTALVKSATPWGLAGAAGAFAFRLVGFSTVRSEHGA